MTKRTIFIGDIHGCYDEFLLLITKLDIKKHDKVYIVGDMINKGPKSYQVIKFCYKNREQFKCIKGNHEINFLRFLEGNNYGNKKQFIKLNNKIVENGKEKYIDFIRELPLYIEKDNFLMIHGGLNPSKNVKEHTEDEITRIREINNYPWYKQYKGEKKVIYGHWAIEGLNVREKTIGLDSGCVYGKELTAYILEDDKIVQQKALEKYEHIGILDIILKKIEKLWKLES